MFIVISFYAAKRYTLFIIYRQISGIFYSILALSRKKCDKKSRKEVFVSKDIVTLRAVKFVNPLFLLTSKLIR